MMCTLIPTGKIRRLRGMSSTLARSGACALSNKTRDLAVLYAETARQSIVGVCNPCHGVRHPSDTFLVETIGSDAVPFEIGKLAGESVHVHRRLSEHTPIQQLVQDAELEVGGEFRIQ